MKKKNEIRSVVEKFVDDKLQYLIEDLDSNQFRNELKNRLFDEKIDDQIDYTYTDESSRVYGEKYRELLVKELTEYVVDKFKEPTFPN
jgi:hypothetical protein